MTGIYPMQRTIPDLDNLFRKAIAASHTRAHAVEAADPKRPPRLVSRSAFADVVSQLLHAERATERMCRLMAGRTGTSLANILLRLQAGDERHHAKLYESYLNRIGDIRPVDARLSEALEAMRETDLGPEAVLAAYNAVLEGEAVKLQQACFDRFTCPPLTRIARAISQDEARHVALMEDYDLTRRMERFGGACCIDTPALVTSSRKFQGRRPIGIVPGWIRIHALYRLGVKPERLSRIYYGR